mmetsp:Transcript_24942/g.67865  ORF Transcript_24942/g.67865 Transcript_24942/m.67865 type:complete len:330 (-) Transcript_24942:325-1314(-)
MSSTSSHPSASVLSHPIADWNADNPVVQRRFLLFLHAIFFWQHQHPITGESGYGPLPATWLMMKNGVVLVDFLVKWVLGYERAWITSPIHREEDGYLPMPDDPSQGIPFASEILSVYECYKFLQKMPFAKQLRNAYLAHVTVNHPQLCFGPSSLYGLVQAADGRNYTVSRQSTVPFNFKRAILQPHMFEGWPFVRGLEQVHESIFDGVVLPAAPRASAGAVPMQHSMLAQPSGSAAHTHDSDMHGQSMMPSGSAAAPSASNAAPSSFEQPLKRKRTAFQGLPDVRQFCMAIKTWKNESYKARCIAAQEEKHKEQKKSFRSARQGGSGSS